MRAMMPCMRGQNPPPCVLSKAPPACLVTEQARKHRIRIMPVKCDKVLIGCEIMIDPEHQIVLRRRIDDHRPLCRHQFQHALMHGEFAIMAAHLGECLSQIKLLFYIAF